MRARQFPCDAQAETVPRSLLVTLVRDRTARKRLVRVPVEFPVRVADTDLHEMACFSAETRILPPCRSTEIRVERIMLLRVCEQASFDQLLAIRFSLPNWPTPEFTSDMKKMFMLSMLIPFAMICSCQKQDSAAEQQPAQHKTEVDARETALI